MTRPKSKLRHLVSGSNLVTYQELQRLGIKL